MCGMRGITRRSPSRSACRCRAFGRPAGRGAVSCTGHEVILSFPGWITRCVPCASETSPSPPRARRKNQRSKPATHPRPHQLLVDNTAPSPSAAPRTLLSIRHTVTCGNPSSLSLIW